jgi:dihydrofolate synthase/folylpolyglutamate synthase
MNLKRHDVKSKLSLERIVYLLKKLGNPQKQLKIVHVAGTNGKGSIVTMVSNILTESGLRVGKYLSPFIDNYCERIQINNEYINSKEFERITRIVKDITKKMTDKPTAFEIITAVALKYFNEQKCDIVCLEVGLGGRFDATNAIDKPLVSVISVIDYDHMDYLGVTIEEIAFEKCGIIKPSGTTVCYPDQLRPAYLVIKAMSAARENEFIVPSLERLRDVAEVGFGYSFSYKGKKYQLGMNGRHQVYNAVTAIETCLALKKQGFKISDENIRIALLNSKFVGRLEVVSEKPLIILDGAHNRSGAWQLGQFLTAQKKKGKNVKLIFGAIVGKDHKAILENIAPLASEIIITKINNKERRGMAPAKLQTIAKQYCPLTTIKESHEGAVKIATTGWDESDIIVITGSLYLVAEFRSLFRK